MTANSFYKNIRSLTYHTNCTSTTINEWDKLMKNATRADKTKIHRLLRDLCPEEFKNFYFDTQPLKKLMWWNPYDYYKTKTHLIVVHSSIEHFFKIN